MPILTLISGLHLWGTFSSQFSCNMGHVPSHIFSMGHSSFPFLAAFIAHYISYHYGGYQFSRGTFHPISSWDTFSFHLIISLDSWGTHPSHSHFCSSNISHFWHTWSSRLFFSLPLLISVHFVKSHFLFYLFSRILFIFTESCLSRLFINALWHGALNLPIPKYSHVCAFSYYNPGFFTS